MKTIQNGKKVWTEAELEALPEDGYLHEVVGGELVMSPKNNWQHGEICARLLTALKTFADSRRLGVVWDSSIRWLICLRSGNGSGCPMSCR